MARQYDAAIPVLDHHCHICFPQPINESLRDYEALFQELSIGEAGLLSCPSSSHNEGGTDVLENLKMLYLKERLSIPCYAYAGFTWHWDEPGRYAEFAEEMLSMGFDGFKALEMHPRVRKQLGKGLNHSSFAGFFETADRHGCLMVCHVGDPRTSWGIQNPSTEMLRLGRVYGDGHCSLDELYEEMEEVIAKYRNMKIILAHFYFMSDNYARVCRLLDENPNVYLDLTPGGEMYVNFTADPGLWREFFLRYPDRIILGSDHYAPGHGRIRYELARNFLEGTEPFEYQGKKIVPFGLPREVLDRIYRGNVRALQGTPPRPVSKDLALRHCLYIKGSCADQLTAQGRENLEVITAYWDGR